MDDTNNKPEIKEIDMKPEYDLYSNYARGTGVANADPALIKSEN